MCILKKKCVTMHRSIQFLVCLKFVYPAVRKKAKRIEAHLAFLHSYIRLIFILDAM